MQRKRFAVGTVVLAAVGAALVFAAAGSGAKSAPFKVAWIYPGLRHNDHGWSQAHDEGRLYVEKKLGLAGSRRRTRKTSSQRQGAPGRGRPRSRRLQDDLRRLVRHVLERRQRPAVQEVPGHHLRAGDGTAGQEEPVRVLRCRRGHDLPLGHGCRRRDQEGVIGYIVPFGIPEVVRHVERVRSRRAGNAPWREGEADLDDGVVLPAEGDGGGPESHLVRCRRARTERRQPVCRGLRGEARGSLGRLRLECPEFRTEVSG